jgi:hypothetical protein
LGLETFLPAFQQVWKVPIVSWNFQTPSSTTPVRMDNLQGSEIQEKKKFRIACHTWNEAQTTFLLEQIIVQIESGLGTDNSNLKKEAWTAVRVAMELKFKVKFDVLVMKNKKAAVAFFHSTLSLSTY